MEVKWLLLCVRPSSLLSKWTGQSEKVLRDVFEYAKRNSPCLIFFDEIDGISSNNTISNDSSHRRLQAEFLLQMSDLLCTDTDASEDYAHNRVVVAAATNVLHDLDHAIQRRFQRRIEVDLPTSEHIKEIFSKLMVVIKI